MAGANISGELVNPSVDIPKGIFQHILIDLIAYMHTYISNRNIMGRVFFHHNLYASGHCCWSSYIEMGIIK